MHHPEYCLFLYRSHPRTHQSEFGAVVNNSSKVCSSCGPPGHVAKLRKFHFAENFGFMKDTRFMYLPHRIFHLNIQSQKHCNAAAVQQYQSSDAIRPGLFIFMQHFYSCIHQGEFPNSLKIAEVVPIFKKGD